MRHEPGLFPTLQPQQTTKKLHFAARHYPSPSLPRSTQTRKLSPPLFITSSFHQPTPQNKRNMFTNRVPYSPTPYDSGLVFVREATDEEFLEDEALMPPPNPSDYAWPPMYVPSGTNTGPRICNPQNTPMAGPYQPMTSAPAVTSAPGEVKPETASARPKRRLQVDVEVTETKETNKRVKLSDHHGGEGPARRPASASHTEVTPKITNGNASNFAHHQQRVHISSRQPQARERLLSLLSHRPSSTPAPTPAAPPPSPPRQPSPVLVTRGNETFDFIDLHCNNPYEVLVDTTGRDIDVTVTQGRIRVTLEVNKQYYWEFEVGKGTRFFVKEGEICQIINANNPKTPRERPGETAVVFLLGRPAAGHD